MQAGSVLFFPYPSLFLFYGRLCVTLALFHLQNFGRIYQKSHLGLEIFLQKSTQLQIKLTFHYYLAFLFLFSILISCLLFFFQRNISVLLNFQIYFDINLFVIYSYFLIFARSVVGPLFSLLALVICVHFLYFSIALVRELSVY